MSRIPLAFVHAGAIHSPLPVGQWASSPLSAPIDHPLRQLELPRYRVLDAHYNPQLQSVRGDRVPPDSYYFDVLLEVENRGQTIQFSEIVIGSLRDGVMYLVIPPDAVGSFGVGSSLWQEN